MKNIKIDKEKVQLKKYETSIITWVNLNKKSHESFQSILTGYDAFIHLLVNCGHPNNQLTMYLSISSSIFLSYMIRIIRGIQRSGQIINWLRKVAVKRKYFLIIYSIFFYIKMV